jgi:small subunit ribosomal protein S4e
MSSKGENKRAKSRSMPRTVQVSKKNDYWTVRTKAGPHTRETSIALGLVVRNFTGIASKMKEAKHILNSGEIKVNGVIRTSHQFAIGLFDAIAVEKQKLFYRVLLDTKGRVVLKQVEAELKHKISRVTNKVMSPKGVQLTTDDGKTYYGVEAKVGDSLKVSLTSGKVESVLPLKEGAVVYMIKGAHCSQTAKITGIVEGTIRRNRLVKLSNGKEEFETTADNVYVVGKDKAELDELK